MTKIGKLVLEWWRDHRPVHMDAEEHREHPTVNITGSETANRLARYAAKLSSQTDNADQ